MKLLREKFGIEPVGRHRAGDRQRRRREHHSRQFGVAAFNAITDGAKLGDCVIDSLKLKTKPAERRVRLKSTERAMQTQQDSRHRARRHRLCCRRPAAPDRGASAARAARRAVGQPARRAGREVVRAPGADLSGAEVLRAWKTITKLAASLPQSAILSAAPHGVAAKLIDDLLTAAEAKGTAAARHRHLRRLSLHAPPARMKRCTSMRTARRHRIAQFTCAVPEHLDKLHDARTSRIPAALRPRCCLRACRC